METNKNRKSVNEALLTIAEKANEGKLTLTQFIDCLSTIDNAVDAEIVITGVYASSVSLVAKTVMKRTDDTGKLYIEDAFALSL